MSRLDAIEARIAGDNLLDLHVHPLHPSDVDCLLRIARAAERLVEEGEPTMVSLRDGARVCTYCHEWRTDIHGPECPWQALRAALDGGREGG